MKIIEITASESQGIQIKDFHPRTPHFSAKAEVSEGEDADKAYAELKKVVLKQLNKRVLEIEAFIKSRGDSLAESPKKPYTPHPKPFPDGEVRIEDLPDPFKSK